MKECIIVIEICIFSRIINIHMNMKNREYHLNVNQIDKELFQHPRSTCRANFVATTKKTTIDSIAWATLPLVWSARVKLVYRVVSRWADSLIWLSHSSQSASSARTVAHPPSSCRTIHRSRQRLVCDPAAGCPLYTKMSE